MVYAAFPVKATVKYGRSLTNLESWEAGIAVTIGLALLTTVVCAVFGSLALARLVFAAIAGIAGLIAAVL
ncbi:hypothetical protein CBI38_32530 (plasmid) [Rhodococcus oxybenzonivorans]|uniref:Uncharacterized protein n=1 Tax=Rhodococcus oxybenzonivorans TaxID=1990687 RepID=A0A2S2C7A0_9NOCA|nr:hypothetical protein CBI38_32530 [Rhodococcus oxybenzonivorans]